MNTPCKIVIASIAFGLLTTGSFAQDSYYGVSAFEGVYIGGYAGGVTNPGAGTLGGVGGANFSVTDGINVGVEAQAGATFGTTTTYDALMMGHVGYEFDDQIMVYGAAGLGVIDGTGSYAFGAGAEAMVVDQVSVRGEVLGTGAWGANPDAAKATAGVLWHVR